MSEPIRAARVTRGLRELLTWLFIWHVRCLVCDWQVTTWHRREIVGLVTQHNIEVHNRQ